MNFQDNEKCRVNVVTKKQYVLKVRWKNEAGLCNCGEALSGPACHVTPTTRLSSAKPSSVSQLSQSPVDCRVGLIECLTQFQSPLLFISAINIPNSSSEVRRFDSIFARTTLQ